MTTKQVNVVCEEGFTKKNGSNTFQTEGIIPGVVSSKIKRNAVVQGEGEDVMNEDDKRRSERNAEEEVSTIYGGRYNPTMHVCSISTQRMEDRLGYTEEGYLEPSINFSGCSRRMRKA